MIPLLQPLPFVVVATQVLVGVMTQPTLITFQMLLSGVLLYGTPGLDPGQLSRLWLQEKSAACFSYFYNEAKWQRKAFALAHLEMLKMHYGKRMKRPGRFIIDDTLLEHSKFVKAIAHVAKFFDHNLEAFIMAISVVVLYIKIDGQIKFPRGFRIYKKSPDEKALLNGKGISRQERKKRKRQAVHQETLTKYHLALELIDEALANGLECHVVLFDSWYCVEPFLKELRLRKLLYVGEIKANRNVLLPYQDKRQGKGKKKRSHEMSLPKYFDQQIHRVLRFGFEADPLTGKPEKTIWLVKQKVIRLKMHKHIPGLKHLIVYSYDESRKQKKFFITNALHWEAKRVINEYSHRWTIEEFFKDVKGLADVEGACVQGEDAVERSLLLAFWVDSLLHLQATSSDTLKPSSAATVTMQSVVREAQKENARRFIEALTQLEPQQAKELGEKWLQLGFIPTRERREAKRPVQLAVGW